MLAIHWSQQAGYPMLAALQLLPLAGAGAVWMLRSQRWSVRLGQGVAVLEFLLALRLRQALDSAEPALQLAERVDLLGPVAYHAAADGVTVLFVLLAALLSLLVAFYAPQRRLTDIPSLLAVILAVEAVLMSLLATVNLLWFIAASALELALVGYLLWRWAASPQKGVALARFYHFQGTGLLLMLAGCLMLGWLHADAHGGRWSFDLLELAGLEVGGTLGTVVFFLLFYGLAVRTPLFPFHGWLPFVAQHGNVSIGPTFLLGIKVGVYGLLRFVFPLLPGPVQAWHSYAVGFAVAGVFYTAFLAFLQRDLRRLLAFAVVSHTSLLVMGLFTMHHAGLQGATLLALNFGFAATTMLFMVGLVYRRTRTTELVRLGGLFDHLPLIGVAFLVSGLAIVGMPGTPGFDAAHLVLEASIDSYGALLTIAAALGNVVAAGFLLFAFQRAFLARRHEEEGQAQVEPATLSEKALAATVIALQLAIGFYLEPWLDLIDPPLQALAARLGGG